MECSLYTSVLQIVSWSEEFLKLGGYAALLTRLNEMLEVEWRYALFCSSVPPFLHFLPQGGAA